MNCVVLILLLVVLGLSLCFLERCVERTESKLCLLGLIPITLIIVCIVIMCINVVNIKTPKAIDVYRNKTSLKITYIDNIPQDTIVIYKQK